MNHITTNRALPVIAILAPNTLMGLGLRSILEKMFPFAAFRVCDSFEEIAHSEPEELFHIFVMANIVVEQSEFFEARHHKTILLTSGAPYTALLDGYPQINISAPQAQIETALQRLHSAAHGERQSPQQSEPQSKDILSPREIEVLQLVVDGLLNKEIAARLNISVTTVISHRKNIVEKTGVRSVAGLTIYAVMKRYIIL
ncbi:MAG: response regulator transcription factor [Rikenellaceae bacterium]